MQGPRDLIVGQPINRLISSGYRLIDNQKPAYRCGGTFNDPCARALSAHAAAVLEVRRGGGGGASSTWASAMDLDTDSHFYNLVIAHRVLLIYNLKYHGGYSFLGVGRVLC